jgi:hypothetical protein
MPLPNLEEIIPHFDITIPSTKETLQFRPFLVKEEKLLLIAMEGDDEGAMLDAIVQAITACALSPIKVEELANFDLEYIFLRLRAESVSPTVELNYRCHNQVELNADEIEKRRIRVTENDGPVFASCDNVVKVTIKIEDVNVNFQEGHTTQIFLTDTLGVNMKYPNFKLAKQMIRLAQDKEKFGNVSNPRNEVDNALLSIALCVHSVFDENSVYTNFTTKEIQEWIEKLTNAQFVKLQEFSQSIPKLAHDVQFRCPKCKYEEPIHIEGLASFFG